MSQLTYNVGMTEHELELLIRLIRDDELTDEEESELDGIARKLKHKRKLLRRKQS